MVCDFCQVYSGRKVLGIEIEEEFFKFGIVSVRYRLARFTAITNNF